MFLIMGVLGILVQGVMLKFLNDCLGERKVIMLAFTLGTATNLCYGLAPSKSWIYIGVSISAFSGIAFPAISAIKSNNVVGVTSACCLRSFAKELASHFFCLLGRIRAGANTRCPVFSTSPCVWFGSGDDALRLSLHQGWSIFGTWINVCRCRGLVHNRYLLFLGATGTFYVASYCKNPVLILSAFRLEPTQKRMTIQGLLCTSDRRNKMRKQRGLFSVRLPRH